MNDNPSFEPSAEPAVELDALLREAVNELTVGECELPADLNERVLQQWSNVQSVMDAKSTTIPSKWRSPRMIKIAIAASVLTIATLFGVGQMRVGDDGNTTVIQSIFGSLGRGLAAVGRFAGPSNSNGRSVLEHCLQLPNNTIRDVAELEEIRKAGEQSTVESLAIGMTPEFNESPVQPGVSPTEVQTREEPWRPNRSADSHRLAFLSEFENLKGLSLFCLYLTENDLETIAGLKKLEKLSLYGVFVLTADSERRITADDLEKLTSLSKLQELDLSQANFEGGATHLAKLPELRALYFTSFEGLNDDSLSELKLLPKLQKLTIAPIFLEGHKKNSKSIVSRTGIESLKEFPSLKQLYVIRHGDHTAPAKDIQKMLPEAYVTLTKGGISLP